MTSINGAVKNIREDTKDMINVVPIAVAYLSGLVGGFVVAAILFVGTRQAPWMQTIILLSGPICSEWLQGSPFVRSLQEYERYSDNKNSEKVT
jgi:hypothetical protein